MLGRSVCFSKDTSPVYHAAAQSPKGENSETIVSESDSMIKEQSDIPVECLVYCWRRGGMGMGILKVVAATPMPCSQVLGGMVAV